MKKLTCCKVIGRDTDMKILFCTAEAKTYYLEIHRYDEEKHDIGISPFCQEHDYPWAGVKMTEKQANEILDLIGYKDE